MECSEARELLSALLDQETTIDERRRADDHLGRCAECRQWWAALGSLRRLLRDRLEEPVPDLSSSIVARLTFERRARRESLRAALLIVLAAELLLGAAGVWRGLGAWSFHDTRHIGWIGAAVVIALLWTELQSDRTRTVAPIVTALSATIAGVVAFDLADGALTTAETHHLVEVLVVAVAWLVARQLCARRRHPPSSAQPRELRQAARRLRVA